VDEVAAEVTALKAEKLAILTTLGALADVVDGSDQGRSWNASGSRNSLRERLKDINERLTLLQPFEYSEVRLG
jgi:hypothetical protein